MAVPTPIRYKRDKFWWSSFFFPSLSFFTFSFFLSPFLARSVGEKRRKNLHLIRCYVKTDDSTMLSNEHQQIFQYSFFPSAFKADVNFGRILHSLFSENKKWLWTTKKLIKYAETRRRKDCECSFKRDRKKWH